MYGISVGLSAPKSSSAAPYRPRRRRPRKCCSQRRSFPRVSFFEGVVTLGNGRTLKIFEDEDDKGGLSRG